MSLLVREELGRTIIGECCRLEVSTLAVCIRFLQGNEVSKGQRKAKYNYFKVSTLSGVELSLYLLDFENRNPLSERKKILKNQREDLRRIVYLEAFSKIA
jgi:hypothetical protein